MAYISQKIYFNTYENGANGQTPHIGNNGNWWIGSEDLGVKAQGADGTSFTGVTEYYCATLDSTPPEWQWPSPSDSWKSAIQETDFGTQNESNVRYKYLWNVEVICSTNAMGDEIYSPSDVSLFQIYNDSRIPKTYISYYAANTSSDAPDMQPELGDNNNSISNSIGSPWQQGNSYAGSADPNNYLFEITFIEYADYDENGKNKFAKVSGPTIIGRNGADALTLVLDNDSDIIAKSVSNKVIGALPVVQASLLRNGVVVQAGAEEILLTAPDNFGQEHYRFNNGQLSIISLPQDFSQGIFIFSYNDLSKKFTLQVVPSAVDYNLLLNKTVVNSSSAGGNITIQVEKIDASGSSSLLSSESTEIDIYKDDNTKPLTSWTIAYDQNHTTPIKLVLKDAQNFIWDEEIIEFVQDGVPGQKGEAGTNGSSVKQLKTYPRSFPAATWKKYAEIGHSENWYTVKDNYVYDNSHLVIGDTVYFSGTVSDAYASTGALQTVVLYGIYEAPTSLGVQLTTTAFVWGGVKGSQGPKGDKGDQGTGVSVKENESACIAIGDGYIDADGNLMILTSLSPREFTNGGQIKGPKGDTTYFHTAYANSADGKDGFSVSEYSNKEFIGHYTDTIEADSNNPSDYKWSKMKGDKGDKGDQGVIGPKGDNGETYYTWIKYADTPTSGMSDDPAGKNYIGIAYNKTTATESDVYSDYAWSLTKGDQGAQGPQGPNGETFYTWIKYADDNLGAGMSDDPANKSYIGLAYNKTTSTESNKPQDYTWSLFKGADGRGVSAIVNYYLVSDKNTDIANNAGDWTVNLQELQLTSTNKYLWNYEEIIYTTGAIEKTDACIIGAYGDSGAAGRGISSIQEYYQISNSNTSAPPDSPAWSTTPLTTTPEQKYLWCYEKINYTTGNSTTSAKRVIGTHGEQGERGEQGEAAVSYKLVISPTSWSGDNQTIVFSVVKYIGSTSSTPNTSEYEIRVNNIKISNTSYSIAATTTFDLYVSGQKVDSQTSSKMEPGKDGPPGPAGTHGVDSKAIRIFYYTDEYVLPTLPSEAATSLGHWTLEGTDATEVDPVVFSSTGTQTTVYSSADDSEGITTYGSWTTPELFKVYNKYGLNQQNYATYLRITNFSTSDGLYYDEDKNLAINATFIKSGTLLVEDQNGETIFSASLNNNGSGQVSMAGWQADREKLYFSHKDEQGRETYPIFLSPTGVQLDDTGEERTVIKAGNKFRVSQTGALYAQNAYLSGTIYATSGTFNGTIKATTGFIGSAESSSQRWAIGGDGLSYGGNSIILSPGSQTSHDIAGSGNKANWMIKAGDKFGVQKDGTLYCKEAHIQGAFSAESRDSTFKIDETGVHFGQDFSIDERGHVTASGSITTNAISTPFFTTNNSGTTIGGWKVDSNALFSTGGEIGLYSSNQSESKVIANSSAKQSWRITAGNNFGVDASGHLYCQNAYISGEINAASGGNIGGYSITNVTLNNASYIGSPAYSGYALSSPDMCLGQDRIQDPRNESKWIDVDCYQQVYITPMGIYLKRWNVGSRGEYEGQLIGSYSYYFSAWINICKYAGAGWS